MIFKFRQLRRILLLRPIIILLSNLLRNNNNNNNNNNHGYGRRRRRRTQIRKTILFLVTCVVFIVVFGFIYQTISLQQRDVKKFSIVVVNDNNGSSNSNSINNNNVDAEAVLMMDNDDDFDDLDFVDDDGCNNNNTITDQKQQVQPPEPPPPLIRSHPHAGARYCNGSYGYIADVKAAKKFVYKQWLLNMKNTNNNTTTVNANSSSSNNSPPSNFLPMTKEELQIICMTPPGSNSKGMEGLEGYKLLTQKISVNSIDPYYLLTNKSNSWSPKPNYNIYNNDNNDDNDNGDNGEKNHTNNNTQRLLLPPRILCIVYTYPKKHLQIKSIIETWGYRCDGFIAASTMTIPYLGIVDIPHIGIESYNNMWQKVRSMWSYVHDNYLDKFDYFYMCGDDAYVIVENLRNFLWSVGGGRQQQKQTEQQQQQQPLYLGSPTKKGNFYMNGGGAGYTLNRIALEMFVNKSLPTCMKSVIASAEDRFMGKCLHQIGIKGYPTWDALGEHRYHGMTPQALMTLDLSLKRHKYWKYKFDFQDKLIGKPRGKKLDRASSQSISFHLLKTTIQLKRHHAILYNSCPKDTILGDALSSIYK